MLNQLHNSVASLSPIVSILHVRFRMRFLPDYYCKVDNEDALQQVRFSFHSQHSIDLKLADYHNPMLTQKPHKHSSNVLPARWMQTMDSKTHDKQFHVFRHCHLLHLQPFSIWFRIRNDFGVVAISTYKAVEACSRCEVWGKDICGATGPCWFNATV